MSDHREKINLESYLISYANLNARGDHRTKCLKKVIEVFDETLKEYFIML